MKSNNFCYEPWVGLDIDNSGLIRPCCKFKEKNAEDWENYNINQSSIDDYKKSNGLTRLKESFLNGAKPVACERCWKDEAANYPSKRQMDYDRWKSEFDEFNLTASDTLLLTLPLGSICNLKCRICSPNSSSSWKKEFQDIYKIKYKASNWENDDLVWQSLLKMTDNILELHLHGGEPFLYDNEKHLEILEKISKSPNSKKIRLHYNTNGTVFPEQKYWDIFEKLGWVDIQPSIDDIGTRFEYNRKNADWNAVEEHLIKYRDYINVRTNMQLSISTTVSVFTIYYLDEMFTYFMDNGLPKPWLGKLSKPEYYRCSIFPTHAREIIKNKLLNSKYEDLQKISQWLDTDDTLFLDKFRENIKLHDSYRKESFKQVFPEIYNWLWF
jgi:MoaA/NifB/PqqE/SkfB family radical SAM enzyme